MPGEGERARPADDYVVVEAPGAQHLEPPLDPETASGTVTNIGYFALPRHYHAPRHSRLHFWAVEVTLPILVCSLGVLFSVATLVLLVRRKGGMWDHGRGGGLGQRADLGGWKERCATGRGKVQSEALGELRPHSSLSIEYPLLPFCSTTPSPKGSRQGTGNEAGLPFWGLSARSDASRQDTRRSKGTLPPQRLAASSSHYPPATQCCGAQVLNLRQRSWSPAHNPCNSCVLPSPQNSYPSPTLTELACPAHLRHPCSRPGRSEGPGQVREQWLRSIACELANLSVSPWRP